MVIDTSALMAILFREPDRDFFIAALDSPGPKLLSAVNALESSIVAEARKGPAGGRELDLLLHRAQIDVVPMTPALVEEAMRVWRAFGIGNHPASLNFCDCCALGFSRLSGQPLLFKGEDFVRASVMPVA
ncbi:MAG: type II toxin-antitoxin system VapC family toxin [Acidobacteria bacterium]|nr:type II toxin-antitoxin system VapC family toxin [Acidobacteriota bacterium]